MIECVSNDIDLLIEKYRGINNVSNYAARFKDDIIKLYYLNKGAAINQIKKLNNCRYARRLNGKNSLKTGISSLKFVNQKTLNLEIQF